MLDGLTGLAQTTQLLLNAFVDHTHAIPKIDVNKEETEENPIFTAPIQTDTETPILDPLPGAPTQNVRKTELGLKTAEIDSKSTELITSFNAQQVSLNNIVDKASDFLSRNQFIN